MGESLGCLFQKFNHVPGMFSLISKNYLLYTFTKYVAEMKERNVPQECIVRIVIMRAMPPTFHSPSAWMWRRSARAFSPCSGKPITPLVRNSCSRPTSTEARGFGCSSRAKSKTSRRSINGVNSVGRWRKKSSPKGTSISHSCTKATKSNFGFTSTSRARALCKSTCTNALW